MLYAHYHLGRDSELFVWKIDESFEQLQSEVSLTPRNQQRLLGMKSESHRLGFLSVRKLFEVAGYTDADVVYDNSGKPQLPNQKHISITHSHGFSSIIISSEAVGIDMERMRDKIKRIADKFTSDEEMKYLDRDAADYVQKLTVLWGIKESIFKIRNEIGISFKDHISSPNFDVNSGKTVAELFFNDSRTFFDIHFMKIEDYMLVYAFNKSEENAL